MEAKTDPVHVTVVFPLKTAPDHQEAARTETAGAVRQTAMKFFGVTEDAGTRYYLTHDGSREPDDRTIGEIAGHAEGLKFNLVKEIIQG